jgi:NAD(P)-binding Rossmann-like domain
MSASLIETEYLIIGSGATAMAFADTLLTESDARIVMVDRHHRPGGHWNDAYPFVRLHQPSAFYGVNSRELGSGAKDRLGFNQGLYELASGAEVLDYFDQVMNQRLLPSGRVRYFPMCSYEHERGPGGEHRFRSLLSGETRQVTVHSKVVNATHARTAVPSTHAPKYAVAPGVRCVPLNELPRIRQPHAGYVVVGAGKTGIDACLWLLQNGVDPAGIRWIMPRDAWLLNRANIQPGLDFFEQSIGSIAAQFEAIAAAAWIPDLFARLEAQELLLRIDPSVAPTMYRCGTVTQAELSALRRIGNIVRLGRVKAIEPARIVLERGSTEIEPDSLIVDCSANGIPEPPAMPVFDGDTINLLMVRTCQPVFSAALIAYVERHVAGEAEQNALCAVVPSPVLPTDWIRMWAVALANRQRWGKHPGLAAWLAQSRGPAWGKPWPSCRNCWRPLPDRHGLRMNEPTLQTLQQPHTEQGTRVYPIIQPWIRY